MEEIALVVLQVLLELLLELLVVIGIDLQWKHESGRVGFGYVSVMLLLGACLGGLVNWIHPQLFLPNENLRLAALVLNPFIAAGVSWEIASYRQSRGTDIIPSNHFITAFCFVLAFEVIRFAFGRR